MEIKQQVEVMLAYGRKVIQIRGRNCQEWTDDTGIRPLCFNWCDFEYRIKPEPREFVLEMNTDGTVRNILERGEAPWFDGAVHIRVREVIE